MSPFIIVTRHPALVEYLARQGIIGQVIPHASEEDVRGRVVYGVLPYRLAALTSRFVEVSMSIPANLRGKELTLQDIESCNPTLTAYAVSVEETFS